MTRDPSSTEAPLVRDAAERIRGVVQRTALLALDLGLPDLELRAKLENRQETGSFKARGAWNQISQLSDAEREIGVVASSSGNHGKALSWAAQRAGVPAVIAMPQSAYPNKIQACRDYGATVVLTPTREEAEEEVARRVAAGAKHVPPYDSYTTIQGAGTVGLEICEEWPEVDVIVVPVGGGGLISGISLAVRQTLGQGVVVIGAEPAGSPSLTRGLTQGKPVFLNEITTEVQGLCPLFSGQVNIDVCREHVDHVLLVGDDAIFAAQRSLVAQGEVVEPAGAAALALLQAGLMPNEVRSLAKDRPLRVAVVVSGGNPAPDQLASLQAALARELK